MSSVTYAAQGYTHLPGLTQSPLWMNGHGDLLSRRLLAGPSSVDLVEAFKMDTNSTALVSNMLQTLTSDAVVTLESPDDSTIARHLAAVKKVLCSYAAVSHRKIATLCHISDATRRTCPVVPRQQTLCHSRQTPSPPRIIRRRHSPAIAFLETLNRI